MPAPARSTFTKVMEILTGQEDDPVAKLMGKPEDTSKEKITKAAKIAKAAQKFSKVTKRLGK